MRAEKAGEEEEEEESKDEHVEARRGAEQLGRREMSTSVRLGGRGLVGGGGGELTKKMPSDQRQAKGSSNIQYNNPQSPSECGSGRWRTGMRSGKGRGEMENKGKELKQCICGREREREGCGERLWADEENAIYNDRFRNRSE